jgi:putative nucleotidyltransferase with HDIG domain
MAQIPFGFVSAAQGRRSLMNDICSAVSAEFGSSDKSDLHSLPFSALVPALSFALDLTEGRPMGHVLRSCVIGMRIGRAIQLPDAILSNLYCALILKDVGCSSNSSRTPEIVGSSESSVKSEASTVWKKRAALDREEGAYHAATAPVSLDELIRSRCERAASISHDLGLAAEVTEAIYAVDERWDGSGSPIGLHGEQISLLARIISIAQAIDIATERFGRVTALEIISRRSGTWFDNDLVVAANLLHDRGELWEDLQPAGLLARVMALEPEHRTQAVVQCSVDDICIAFAEVVDAKSPFTFAHSTGVARVAVSIAERMGVDQESVKILHRAALLHDIGKLSVPTSILEKPCGLNEAEWSYIHQHPRYTWEILSKIPGFEEIAIIAAAHHERLDGSGYPHGLSESELPLLARILAVADVYDALSCSRPYRKKLDSEQVLKLMRGDGPHALDQSCLNALASVAKQAYLV